MSFQRLKYKSLTQILRINFAHKEQQKICIEEREKEKNLKIVYFRQEGSFYSQGNKRNDKRRLIFFQLREIEDNEGKQQLKVVIDQFSNTTRNLFIQKQNSFMISHLISRFVKLLDKLAFSFNHHHLCDFSSANESTIYRSTFYHFIDLKMFVELLKWKR
jgi:hypothetical protein